MRFGLVTTSIISLLLALFQTAAAANEIQYTVPGKDNTGTFSGQLPLASLGSVLLPRGMVSLEGDELKVLAVPPWLFDRNLVFRGAIVRAQAVRQPNSSVVGGLVYFYDGQWLASLGGTDATDVIDTLDGVQHRGRVTGRAGEKFVFRRKNGTIQNISLADIKSIRSPRAFTFNIATPVLKLSPSNTTMSFESNLIALTPAGQQQTLLLPARASVPISTLAGTEKGISNRALATFIALDIMTELVPAIAIPLVINKKNTQGAQNAINQFNLQSNQAAGQSSQSTASLSTPGTGP